MNVYIRFLHYNKSEMGSSDWFTSTQLLDVWTTQAEALQADNSAVGKLSPGKGVVSDCNGHIMTHYKLAPFMPGDTESDVCIAVVKRELQRFS